MTEIDDLIRGSIDIHAHGYPEIAMDFAGPGHMESCLSWAREAREEGMTGFLIKSHTFPSIILAQTIDAEINGIDIYGSAVLNPPSGGIDPLTAEIAGRLESAIVYMPTWSAAHDIECGGFSAHVADYYDHFVPETFEGHRILDRHGDVKPEVLSVLDELARFDVTVGTGHISPKESLALAEATADRELRLVFDHPTSGSINATVEQTKEMANAGAFIEFVVLAAVSRFKRMDYEELGAYIRDVGIDNCVLATDAFSEDVPSPPTLLRRGLEGLADAGFSEAELRTMIHDNPRRALGL